MKTRQRLSGSSRRVRGLGWHNPRPQTSVLEAGGATGTQHRAPVSFFGTLSLRDHPLRQAPLGNHGDGSDRDGGCALCCHRGHHLRPLLLQLRPEDPRPRERAQEQLHRGHFSPGSLALHRAWSPSPAPAESPELLDCRVRLAAPQLLVGQARLSLQQALSGVSLLPGLHICLSMFHKLLAFFPFCWLCPVSWGS